jgi:hypothetical protein
MDRPSDDTIYPDSVAEQVERDGLIKNLVADCEPLASERADRYFRARHHGIVADTPFAPASSECIELFRDGHFYGAISLSQAVGEALVRHMCHSNGWKPAENFERNVGKLKQRGFVDTAVEAELLRLWEKRDDYHHLNPNVVRDRGELEELALAKIRALGEIEAFVFAWSPRQTAGAIKLLRPQYWPGKENNQVGVYLRNPKV